ncbi:hypothetical protein [Carboxylicivirga caseinilyticus]|uniref:hypothetical protein n=1 Tax=Carboxylicivirga caseinilyticus TaxID=3417572 RepID=UPI003D32CAD0|nr:hypothetical protein [Marinilabiliaceae bacterium A049]
MKISIDIKHQLVNQMQELLNEKMTTLSKAMEETIESMQNDTKSSAGDKFETGREMMQIELNNLRVQMSQLQQANHDLAKVNASLSTNKVSFGSLVKTNLGNYFISIALGKIKIENQDYYSISLASPVGKILKDKQAGVDVQFNGKTLKIEEII